MKSAGLVAACAGCFAGTGVHAGGRPSGRTPVAELAAQFELGGMAKRGPRYYSLAATLDVAGYPGYREKVSSGLSARLEWRRPLDLSNDRFRLWVAQLHGAVGAEPGADESELRPTVSAFVGYGRGANRTEANLYAAWSVGLIASRASLDEHGGAWFLGVGAGLRLGFWQDRLRDQEGHQ